MKKILTAEELVVTIASSGDPMAFHSLFGERIRSSYAQARAGGAAAPEAARSTIDKTVEMFRSFVGTTTDDADSWYDERSGAGKNGDSEESFPPKVPENEFSAFDRQLQLALQRSAAQLKSRSRRRDPAGDLRNRRRVLVPVAVMVVTLAAVAIAYLLLLVTRSTLTVTFAGPQKVFSFSAPGGLDLADPVSPSHGKPAPAEVVVAADSATAVDSAQSSPKQPELGTATRIAQQASTPAPVARPRPRPRPAYQPPAPEATAAPSSYPYSAQPSVPRTERPSTPPPDPASTSPTEPEVAPGDQTP